MRKILQIAVTSTEENGDAVFALCSDGTVWSSVSGTHGWTSWHQLPKIPQPPMPESWKEAA